MSYEIYRYIFYGGAILAGIMLATTILLFFTLKIPSVIGYLTGATAKKAIENIRNQNSAGSGERYKTSKINRERGKITDKITPSGNLIKNPSVALEGRVAATEKISTQELPPESETTVLTAETTVLSAETTVLGEASGGETTLLNEPAGETTVLGQAAVASVFNIEYEITIIHTNEVIA